MPTRELAKLPGPHAQPKGAGRRRGWSARPLSLLLVALALVAGVWCVTKGRAGAVTHAAAEPAPAAQDMSGQDFSKYLHNSPKHATIACAACHQRAGDNSVQVMYNGRASLPGHKACTDCHLAQFVQQNNQICSICHTDLNSRRPPTKGFPGLQSFNARFDHAQHNVGAARPASGCASCHTPAGRRNVALSIPASYNAHAQCYTCHTPNAQYNGRDMASCGVCHQPGRAFRTSTAARAFNVSFSHAEHGGRQGLNCNDCHNLRAGAPQARQVTVPVAAQHFASSRAQTCMSCHNGRRAFGDQNFDDCARCHKGASFRM